ncbi:hypothetical protein LSH36_1g13005 [Paralvinella palmiformis]|uniref:C3H1-type domain-containing protein n=1 Tax=Paralvinella palmiformis TaxID=53620 RepID=A0AAD9KHK5_9ANNE|nr:hypothetical protein LSH36_1g13005 [Paralvinella palmiformis]
MIPPTSTSLSNIETESEVEQRICQKVIQELLRSQSVSGFAASLDPQRAPSPPKGVPIIGRNGNDETPATESINSARIAALIKKLKDDETTSLFVAPEHGKLGRSVSLPEDRMKMGLKTMNMDRYKTELCRQFQETGFCKYGSKCQFAHGHHEIRSTARHPKYKTELCRTYHTSGICPYGTRCHFIHDEDDLKLSAISYQKQQHVIDQIRQYRAMQQAPVSPTNSINSRSSRGFGAAMSFPDVAMSLGSAGDTPPSSLSSSPVPSPTCFLYEDRQISSSSQFVAAPGYPMQPRTAPATMHEPFSFPDVPSTIPEAAHEFRVPSPLNIHVSCDPMESLAAGLQAAVPRGDIDLVNDCLSDFYMTPSVSYGRETEIEVCNSPMDISRNLRLPVFSQLSKE